MNDLNEAAQMVAGAVRDQVSDVAADIGQEAQKTASELKARGSDAIKVYAHAAHAAASDLEEQSPGIAERVRAAANSVDQFSEKIKNRDIENLIHELRDVARSQPALFFGGAVAAGFAFARFMKSSERHSRPMQASMGSQGTMPRQGSLSDGRTMSRQGNFPDEGMLP
jgi:hypothetical protein